MPSLGLGYMPKDIDGRLEAGSMLDTSAKQGIFKRTRLVIADRQPIVLQGLKSVLGAQPDFDVVASCSDGTSCIQAIRNLAPDVAFLADTLPDLTASEILAIAEAERLPTRLVFFTDSETDRDLTSAIAAGACDAIAKDLAPDAMLRSLRLMTKRSFLEQSDLTPTAEETDSSKIENLLELLTPRERQVVRLVSEGMSNKEIAHQLNVSDGTIKVHLHNIFQKLEITNRTVLATLALLQRPSGFGMFSLALLAVAIADELKASEANDMLPDDDSTGPAAEHAEYEPWKRAILRLVIVSESDEKPALSRRDVFVEASQTSIAASAIEALRIAEQSASSKSRKDCSFVGSSTPDLATPSLRGMKDAQIGSESTAEHLFPRPASNPTLIQAGYGTFATLTGALIYALNDSHLALRSHEPAKALLDSFVDITGDDASTKLAAITNADDNHVENSVRGLLAHDTRLPSAFVTTEIESVAGEGIRSHISDGTMGETLQEFPGLMQLGHDGGIGGDNRDRLTGGDVAENVVHHDPTDSNFTSSDSVFNFVSGPSRINLAAFGALAWLHMTAASKSIPPHTVAWIFDSASNETIVYVNPTDHVLEIGDRGLLEIHLRGIVSIAESDFVGQPTGANAAITLEQLEEALASVTATETVLSTDSAHAMIGTSESPFGTAGVWDILADVGLRTEFAPTRTGTSKFGTLMGDSARPTNESGDEAGGSAVVSPIVLVHAATLTAVEGPTLNGQPNDASTDPCIAAADSVGSGNSQHVLEPWPAKETGAKQTEADIIPGSDVDDENGDRSPASDPSGGSVKKETDRAEHGKPVPSTSTSAPEAPESGESSLAIAHRDDREGARHAPEQMSAMAGARDVAEVKSIPGNRAGNENAHHSPASDGAPGPAKTAEPGGLGHGNLHASERGPATAATETAEVRSIPGNRAGNENAHHSPASDGAPGPAKTAEPGGLGHGNLHASERGPATAATETAEVRSIPGNRTGTENAHDSLASDGSSGPAKMAEPGGLGHSNLHASERGPATAATETIEAKAIPGNGVGNDNEHHSWTPADTPGPAKMAKPSGMEHSNKWGHSTSAHGPKADESVATAGSADLGSTQSVAEPEPVKATTTELAETVFMSEKSVGDGDNHRASNESASAAVATAKPADLQHSNSGYNSHSTSVNASAAAEIAESSATKGESAGNGSSQHATQPAAIASVAAQPAKAAFETGGADQDRVFRFDSDATPFTPIVRIEPREVHIPLDPRAQPGQAATLDILVKILPNALDEPAANHGNNGPHHATVPAHHDLLI